MGNASSGSSQGAAKTRSGGVLLLLQRTWTVIVAEKWSKRRVVSDSGSEFCSQYSYCSCPECLRDDGFSSSWYSSDLFETDCNMPPNTQEITKVGPFPFLEDAANKQDKQRPPIYNPEDYALSLKKWGRKPPGVGGGLYSGSGGNAETDSGRAKNSYRDYSNPMLMSSGSEMTLRQFGSVSELLTKLKADLRLAYPSFIQEFVSEPLDGLTLLLELLRAIQLSQCGSGSISASGANTVGKVPPSVQRRALLDEHSCLQCLLICCQRYNQAVRKMISSTAGLFALAVCIMSNVNKSRIIALQLLSKVCEGEGHSAVSEALSTLRLRFGEPVRFRFLVGTLMSTGGQGELLVAGLEFINAFLDATGSIQKRLYVQAELEQAGFDINVIKKLIPQNNSIGDKIYSEIKHMEKRHVDVEALVVRVKKVEDENVALKDKVKLLERKIQILQEEKGVLVSLEQCLKDLCSELQGEVTSLKSGNNSNNQQKNYSKRSDSNPEDEGISSSERSLTPEGDIQRDSSIYEMYSVQSETIQIKKEEDEPTIDDVIEELKNIINDAETEHYREEKKRLEELNQRKNSITSNGKIVIRTDDISFSIVEPEIEPSNLHPQPPRKTRSLIHVYIPAEDYDCETKEMFFENETNFTSDEGSDSLLSASRCQQQQQQQKKPEFLSRVEIKPEKQYSKVKSKSLDRIDDGLDAMVDIVVTEDVHRKPEPLKRSISNVFVTHFGDDKQRMFLPPKKFELGSESPYYFPRVQEKKSSTSGSFLVRRGHGNAGMYSGFILRGDFVSGNFKGGGCGGKVTDLPSGLY